MKLLSQLTWHTTLKVGLAALTFAASAASAQTAICYNCPTEWADWGTQIKAIKENTGINVPADNKNSGQTLAQLITEKASPVADVAYMGVSFGIQADKAGVVSGYKPANWDDIPEGLKDPNGKWFTITLALWDFLLTETPLTASPFQNLGLICSSPNTKA
jgi:putative spermidine/putrescine transport system substrate-binding protein